MHNEGAGYIQPPLSKTKFFTPETIVVSHLNYLFMGNKITLLPHNNNLTCSLSNIN